MNKVVILLCLSALIGCASKPTYKSYDATDKACISLKSGKASDGRTYDLIIKKVDGVSIKGALEEHYVEYNHFPICVKPGKHQFETKLVIHAKFNPLTLKPIISGYGATDYIVLELASGRSYSLGAMLSEGERLILLHDVTDKNERKLVLEFDWDHDIGNKIPTKVPLAYQMKTLNGIATDQDLDVFSSSYYVYPRPDLVPQVIKYIDAKKLSSRKNTVIPMTIFFSILLHSNPEEVTKWKLLIEQQDDATRSMLAKAQRKDPESILKEIKLSPALNDAYWAAYFATGDIKYVDKLISHLRFINEREDAVLYLTAASAM